MAWHIGTNRGAGRVTRKRRGLWSLNRDAQGFPWRSELTNYFGGVIAASLAWSLVFGSGNAPMARSGHGQLR